MEQIVKYNEITSIEDFNDSIMAVPVTVIQKEDGKIEFAFANYEGLIATLKNIVSEYETDFEVDEKNVSAYEDKAAQLKKLVKKISDSAKEFCDNFCVPLLGRHKGKNRVDGQVDIASKILLDAYDLIHEKTVAVRDAAKAKKIAQDVIEAELDGGETLSEITVLVPESKKKEFIKYVTENGISIKG